VFPLSGIFLWRKVVEIGEKERKQMPQVENA
jgi:hypothetical protein